MKKVLPGVMLLLGVLSFTALQAQKIFLKAIMPGAGDYSGLVKGTAVDEGHRDEVIVYSYSTGISSCTPNFGSGQQSCKPSVGNLNFLMPLSGGTNQLKYAVLTGTKMKTADFVFENSSGDRAFAYYKIHMEDVTVVSIQESGSGEPPFFSVELAAARVAWAVYKQDERGGVVLESKLGFNLATNSIWQYPF